MNIRVHIHLHTHLSPASAELQSSDAKQTPLRSVQKPPSPVCLMLCDQCLQNAVLFHSGLFTFRTWDGSRKLEVCKSEINELNLVRNSAGFRRDSPSPTGRGQVKRGKSFAFIQQDGYK